MNYQYDSSSGLLKNVRQCASPNCDDRPDSIEPDVLVIHAISLPPGEFGGPGIEQLFTNQLNPKEHPYYREIEGMEVSSHLLIRRNGDVIQYVPLNRRAWHAGDSECEGRTRVNDFSIGIELEGTDEQNFESAQYTVLADLTKMIMKQFPAIRPERIYGHSQISPGRKTDPGPFFDWDFFHSQISQSK